MPVGKREAFSIQTLQLVDAGLVWLGFWLADLLRSPVRELFGEVATEAAGLAQVSWVLYVAVPFTPLALEFFRFYRRLRSKDGFQAISQLFRGMLLMGLAIGLLSLFSTLPEASRLVLGLGAVIIFFLLLARDRFLSRFLRARGVRDELKERVILAGTPGEMNDFLAELDPEIAEGIKVVGRFDLGRDEVKDLYQILKRESAERVIIAAGDSAFANVAKCVEACELQGVEAWIAASFMRTQVARPTFDVMGERPMLVLRSTPELSWEIGLKAVFDRVGAAFIILLTLPLWIVAWVGITLTSPGGSAFFAQKRAGRYGKPFRMWKFRTMVPNAEELLKKIKEEQGNEMDGPVFKLQNDPRIFAFGAFLRKWSIDELPQLINVLMGDMSLVGPRPLPLYEVEAFEESAHRRRLSVKPGITCEWQAGGRNSITSFDQWVEMDLRYIDNWSIWLDFKILLKTVPAVLFGWGAK